MAGLSEEHAVTYLLRFQYYLTRGRRRLAGHVHDGARADVPSRLLLKVLDQKVGCTDLHLRAPVPVNQFVCKCIVFSQTTMYVEAELELETCCEMCGGSLNFIPHIHHSCFYIRQIAFICADAWPARGALRVPRRSVADSPGQHATAGRGMCLLPGPLPERSECPAHRALARGYVVSQGWPLQGCTTNGTTTKDTRWGSSPEAYSLPLLPMSTFPFTLRRHRLFYPWTGLGRHSICNFAGLPDNRSKAGCTVPSMQSTFSRRGVVLPAHMKASS